MNFVRAIAVILVAATSVLTAQTQPRPVTLVSEVRNAIMTAHDLRRAEELVTKARADRGTADPEFLEALSWLGRGALFDKQYDKAEAYAQETRRLTLAALKNTTVDNDAHLEIALGASQEVQAQVSAARGERSEAIAFLNKELATYGKTKLAKRIQKNINLLTLEGHPAPPLDASEWIGTKRPPSLADLKGKIVVMFFWAHWCPDCKIEGPILAKMYAKYQSQGVTIVAPTQRYGYVAGGANASPDEELKYIIQVREQYYPFLADLPVPVSVADHQRYGVSTTPTMVIVDRQGIVRAYHPGRYTEEELDAQIRALLGT
jgi:thiol-disulfide isomerase/thioredoxin